MEYVLRTFGLCKKYKSKKAVDDACMSIRKGDIYGFVGENGSGKTTLIRLITGLIHADAGHFELFGTKSTDSAISIARRKLGAIVESPSVYRNMSARDNLRLQASLLGITDGEKIENALRCVGLSYLADEKKKAGDFSLGMRQRLGIAMALLGDPEFIILDEPMNGLDPAGIVEIRELILRLNRENGITFLISSHILTELALVATRYGIISRGHIIEEISSDELHGKFGRFVLIRAENTEKLLADVRELLPQNEVTLDGELVRISGELELNSLLGGIIERGNRILEVNCTETSFEQYYLAVTGGTKNA